MEAARRSFAVGADRTFCNCSIAQAHSELLRGHSEVLAQRKMNDAGSAKPQIRPLSPSQPKAPGIGPGPLARLSALKGYATAQGSPLSALGRG